MSIQQSMQLFSGRNFPPLDDQLQLLARLGYRHVEPFQGLYDDLEGLVSALQETGLSAPSAHFSVELLEDNYAKSLEIAKALGVRIVILPFLQPDERPDDVAGWIEFGSRLASIAERLRGDGLRMAWHNHDFEVIALSDGSRPLDHILAADPHIEWEVDLAWIARSGQTPSEWLERYSDRICSVHVKDIAPEGQNLEEDGWADVGEGILDWEHLWWLSRRTAAELMVAEHDNPSDFERFARRSGEAMQRFERGV